MRVVHVTPYFAPAFCYGGPPRSVLGLCKGLQHAGVDVEVLTTVANGAEDLETSPAEGTTYEGVPVRYLPLAFPRRLFGVHLNAPLAAALARADLCHIHGIWNIPEWSAARLARSSAMPYVLSPRGMLQAGALGHRRWRKSIAFRLVERANIAGASLLHATSTAEADELGALGLGVPVVVVPNGVDTAAASHAQADLRDCLHIPRDAFVVVFVGRIHAIKRLDLLSAAFSLLRGTYPSAHLIVAGPDEQNRLGAIVRSLAPHAPFVHAIGAVGDDDKWRVLRAADAAVQCSDSESFGLVTVEAMSAGVPVVVTRTCPWSEVETRGAGFWVEQTSPAIANALGQLAADPRRARAMGQRGIALVNERYGWDAIGRRVAGAYADVLAREQGHRVA